MKKGFTLIELLGVLTVLAIISFIAVPIIINIINDSRDKALERSLEGYIKAVNTAVAQKSRESIFENTICTIESNGNLNCNDEVYNVPANNVDNISGSILISNYTVVAYSKINIKGKEFSKPLDTVFRILPEENDTHKGIVYMDPTDLTKKCTAQLAMANISEYRTHTGATSGCMKFYVYDDTGDNYKLILDHNTTGWASWSYDELEPLAALSQLKEDTFGWIGNIGLIDATYVAHLVGADRSDTLQWVPHLPEDDTSGLEISWLYLDGLKNPNKTSYSREDGWLKQYANNVVKSDYTWLFDYTDDCVRFGCNVEETYFGNRGYWTSDYYNIDYYWCIESDGSLSKHGNDYGIGIRPTVTLSKEYISDKSLNEVESEEIGDFGGTIILEEPNSTNTYKGIVYMDPTDFSSTCNAQLAAQNLNNNDTPTGITSGCMKFYIYDDSGAFYKLILDHNTTPLVAWANEEDYLEAGGTQADWDNGLLTIMGPVTANKQLEIDTEGWVGNPRLMSANEVAHIVGIDEALGWNINVYGKDYWFYLDGQGDTFDGWWNEENGEDYIASETNRSRYAWLYDYTDYCVWYGCNLEDNNNYYYYVEGTSDNSLSNVNQDNKILLASTSLLAYTVSSRITYPTYGYWLSSNLAGRPDELDYACYIESGYIYSTEANSIIYGIRPVITLAKTAFGSNPSNLSNVQFNGTKVAATSNDTHKGIVYLDPTNLSTTCNAQIAAANLNNESTPTPTGITSGCMKFYIYDDEGSTYKMILDHNTSGSLHWSDVGDRLIEDTTGWAGSPRLITADEVAHIVGIDEALGWDSTDPNADRFFFDGSGTEYSGWQIYYGYGDVSYRLFHSRYAWLYNNTEYCMCGGCEVEDNNQYPYGTMDSENTSPIYGYFTSTPFANGSAGMWFIDRAGIDNSYYASQINTAGVRPVITLPKSIFE